MLCPACQRENPATAKFCARCGVRLGATCPKCGAELPLAADTHFCVECGAELDAPSSSGAVAHEPAAGRLQRLVPKEYAERLLATRGQPHDERRTVTILFSDVKGSTAMGERLDPEEVKEIILGAFEFLIAPIYRYEGTLVQLMGDAILAFFGAPIAHEDDPERACRAALEITAEAQRYAEKLKAERGIEGFGVRVGINTGLVVVGEVGSDLRVAYTAVGDAINLAARMEQNAEPGTVLITEATHKLIAPLFETQALGPMQVKGKAERVPVYRVVAAKVVAGKVRGIAGLESPLVGREAESGALREAVERLQAGVGGIVTIVGEAGLGKSRLVAECKTDCQSVLQWVEGRCLSYTTSIAYQLWLDVLRGVLDVTAEDSLERARERLRERLRTLFGESAGRYSPYLAQLLSLPLTGQERATIESLDGEKLKDATFRAASTLIRGVASVKPLVIVCEDLHWADPTSIDLLHHVLPLIRAVPVLFICVFRPDKGHSSWQLRAEAARSYAKAHVDLTLQPLSDLQGEKLLDNLMGVERLPETLTERVLSQADGNPFYVEEIIRALLGSGILVHDRETGRWQVTQDAADIAIPETLHGVLMARIDRLPENTKRVLQAAAVIGRIFLYRVLMTLAEEREGLEQHLLTLQQEEMVRERARMPELEYIFKHELTREAAYQTLLKKERRAMHRHVAEALEHLFPQRIEEHLGLLAYHWEQSGDLERATGYLLRAGDKARLAYAHQESIEYYQRAQTMLQKSGRGTDGQWLAAEEGLGDVRAVLGEHGRALAHYERARALAASAAGSSERLAGLCRKTAMLHERKGQYAAALQWLDQGLSAVGVEQTLETSRIRLAGAGVHSRQGQHHQALEWCQLGLEIARQLNAPAELAHGTYLLGTIHGHLGHSADEIACARQSVALYEDTGDLVGQANALNNLGIACKESGDWDAAMDCFKRALELDEELGNVHDVAKVTNNLGNVLLQRGQLDGAAQAYHKSLDLWTAIDFPLGVALSLSNLGEVGVEGGEWEAALDNLKRSEQLFQQIQSQHFLPEVYRRQALAYLGLGQAAEAQRNAERSVSLAAELGMELEKALSLRVLGHVLVALGKWAQAEEPLLSSLDVLKRQDNRFGMGQTLHQLGCLYHEQSRAGDTAAADNSRAALESARTIFAELGAQRELEKVREAMT